jgi:DHA1 family inner membrane transport protein
MYSLDAGHERRLLWLLALTQFTVIMDFMVMMPLGPQVMRAFQLTPGAFATAISVYSWCSGLSGLFVATYIDRFDRRRLLLTVYAIFAISNLACAGATNFHALVLAGGFAGVTGGVLGSVVMAIVSDVIPVARRGAATGTIMTAYSLAAVFGVAAGIVLGARFGWSAPFVLLVAFSLLICLCATYTVPKLSEHLGQKTPAVASVLPALWTLVSNSRHLVAFVLTFATMVSHYLLVPFMAPVCWLQTMASRRRSCRGSTWPGVPSHSSRRVGSNGCRTAMAADLCFGGSRYFAYHRSYF